MNACTCNKRILLSNRNTSLNANRYSEFLFCSQTIRKNNANITEAKKLIFRLPFFNLILRSTEVV